MLRDRKGAGRLVHRGEALHPQPGTGRPPEELPRPRLCWVRIGGKTTEMRGISPPHPPPAVRPGTAGGRVSGGCGRKASGQGPAWGPQDGDGQRDGDRDSGTGTGTAGSGQGQQDRDRQRGQEEPGPGRWCVHACVHETVTTASAAAPFGKKFTISLLLEEKTRQGRGLTYFSSRGWQQSPACAAKRFT